MSSAHMLHWPPGPATWGVRRPARVSGSLSTSAEPSIAWLWRLRAPASESPREQSAPSVAGRRTPKMARLEAVLLVADSPLSPRRLAQLATLADATEARTLVNRLTAAYEQSQSAFRVERVASG